MRSFLVHSFLASLLFVSALAPATPQHTVVALNPQFRQVEDQLCAIQFDPDSSISLASDDCLALLVSTLKVQRQLVLVLTGTPAHTAALKNYLEQHASVSSGSIRTIPTGSGDADLVLTSLVKPPPAFDVEATPMAEATAMAPMASTPPSPHAVGAGAPSGGSTPYALGNEAQAWKASLQNGAIEYNVPKVMIAQQASMVTVIVHGYQDPNPHLLANSTDTVHANLKVADMMEVELTGSPTEFTIAPQATQSTQFVPVDGYATWIWSVTPNDKALAQQLNIKVSLIPDASSGLPSQPLADAPYAVDVTVQSLWSVLSDRWHQDPMKAIEYVLPGGAGWAALGTLLTTLGVGTWLRNKLNKSSASKAGNNPTPAV